MEGKSPYVVPGVTSARGAAVEEEAVDAEVDEAAERHDVSLLPPTVICLTPPDESMVTARTMCTDRSTPSLLTGGVLQGEHELSAGSNVSLPCNALVIGIAKIRTGGNETSAE